jgi:DNA repair exonuclease SbcCD ATPase subunit
VAAKLKHEQAEAHVSSLKEEVSNLETQLAALADADDAYRALLEQKAELLAKQDAELREQLSRLIEQLADTDSLLKELDEAESAGRSAATVIDSVIDSLDSAANWGKVDILGGGLLFTAIKHQHLNDARGLAWAAQDAIQRFLRELRDVDSSEEDSAWGELTLGIGDGTVALDHVFDGLLFDLLVQQKIGEARRTVEETKGQLLQKTGQLRLLRERAEQRAALLTEQWTTLVEVA